jgi:hypothetical protein
MITKTPKQFGVFIFYTIQKGIIFAHFLGSLSKEKTTHEIV